MKERKIRHDTLPGLYRLMFYDCTAYVLPLIYDGILGALGLETLPGRVLGIAVKVFDRDYHTYYVMPSGEFPSRPLLPPSIPPPSVTPCRPPWPLLTDGLYIHTTLPGASA